MGWLIGLGAEESHPTHNLTEEKEKIKIEFPYLPPKHLSVSKYSPNAKLETINHRESIAKYS